MKIEKLIAHINEGGLDDALSALYAGADLVSLRARYLDAAENFLGLYGGGRDVALFSVPGRSELSGNHTDHNHGCVIACSVDLDIIAVASPREDRVVRIKSEGYPQDRVDIDAFSSPDPARRGKSISLIAGVIDGFSRAGYAAGGFDAYTTSSVLKGSGLSSSAAFEVMVGNILNHLYNGGRVGFVEIAKIAQYAENEFFGKPCGLMDQVACAAGGIVAIDFADPSSPVIEKLDADITALGYSLCIVDTGGNHADLTDDYASVPSEMKAVAERLGAPFLREVPEEKLLSSIGALRSECGDRALLRALHFYGENRRVASQKAALLRGDIDDYFASVIASGRSSFCYLQNVYTTRNVAEQGLSVALCLAEQYLTGKKGAWRVHGGGFAGTIQAYVRAGDAEGFRRIMDSVFGAGACAELHIRESGAVRII